MNILITGAFGNIGLSAVRELIKKGHNVRCFDIKTKSNLKKYNSLDEKPDLIWGDIRDNETVTGSMEGIDMVMHLAFIIPPLSEKDMDVSWDINVDGTRNILKAMKGSDRKPKIIFASSIAVFGNTEDPGPLKYSGEQVKPTDAYSHHKIVCEHLIRTSGLEWCIMRLGAVLVLNFTDIDPMLFQVPLNSRVELIHYKDGAHAFVNAVESNDVWGKVLLIGGGEKCQMYQNEFIDKVLNAVGIGSLDKTAFSKQPFYLDWMDTSESQGLLDYQKHDLDDFILEIKKSLGIKRYLARLVRPILKRNLLKHSPYYRTGLKEDGHKKHTRRRFIQKPTVSQGSI